MLNPELLTENERNRLNRLFKLWTNYQKIAGDLKNEKAWLEYDESHYGEELYGEQKKIIDKTLEMVRPAMNNAWRIYSDEWSRLNKKYS